MTLLHEMTMQQAIDAWDTYDEKSTNLAGIRALCETDLFYLLVKVCGRTDMLHPWVYERCREVEANPDGHLDLWGREHFKSSVITFGKTLQDILNNPEICIGIFSENYTLAQKFLIQLKSEFENNTVLKQAFPDILYDKPHVQARLWNTDGIIVKRTGNPKEPTVECQGLLSMKTGAHYDLIVYDDIITLNSVTSPEMVEKITSYLEVSLSQSKQGGVKRYIGTRYSYADTYQTILDRDMAIPRIYAATDNGKPTGTPVLFTEEYWEQKKKENSDYNLACQYLQNPSIGQETVFQTQNLQPYEVRPLKLNVAIIMDPAKKVKKTSDRTAILVIGVSNNKRKYLLDGVCHRMPLAERWEQLRRLYKNWHGKPGVRTIKTFVETYGAGEVDLDFFREQMKKEDIKFAIEPLTGSLNGSNRKRDRIERIQPDLRYSNIFLPYPTNKDKLTKAQINADQSGNADLISRSIRYYNENRKVYDVSDIFVQELTDFPFGSHDDAIDCFSRIYDTNIQAPVGNRGSYAVPENELT